MTYLITYVNQLMTVRTFCSFKKLWRLMHNFWLGFVMHYLLMSLRLGGLFYFISLRLFEELFVSLT